MKIKLLAYSILFISSLLLSSEDVAAQNKSASCSDFLKKNEIVSIDTLLSFHDGLETFFVEWMSAHGWQYLTSQSNDTQITYVHNLTSNSTNNSYNSFLTYTKHNALVKNINWFYYQPELKPCITKYLRNNGFAGIDVNNKKESVTMFYQDDTGRQVQVTEYIANTNTPRFLQITIPEKIDYSNFFRNVKKHSHVDTLIISPE